MAFVDAPVGLVSLAGDQRQPVELRGELLRRASGRRGRLRAGPAVDGEAGLAAQLGQGQAAGCAVGVAPGETLVPLLLGVGVRGVLEELAVRAALQVVTEGHESPLDDGDVVVLQAGLDVGQRDPRAGLRGSGRTGRWRLVPGAAANHHAKGGGALGEGQSRHHRRRRNGLEPLEDQRRVGGGQAGQAHHGIGVLQVETVARQVDGEQPYQVGVAVAQGRQGADGRLDGDLQRQSRRCLVAERHRRVGGTVGVGVSLVGAQHETGEGRGQRPTSPDGQRLGYVERRIARR